MYWNTLERSGLSIFDLHVSLGRAIEPYIRFSATMHNNLKLLMNLPFIMILFFNLQGVRLKHTHDGDDIFKLYRAWLGLDICTGIEHFNHNLRNILTFS